MAINGWILEVLARVAEKLPAPRRMLSLGYPDMLVTEPQLERICGAGALASIDFREDSQAILKWHGLEGQMPRVAETRSVLRRLDIEADFVDIAASRGVEIVLDLNQPAPPERLGRYDIVYDGGTMEHCFNVGQVMRNILGFVRKGGFIVHVNPMTLINHGFYNFNPTFYHDWYTQSGNTIASPFYAMHGGVLAPQVTVVDATSRIRSVPDGTVLVVAALKSSETEPAWPMQHKYTLNPGLKG
jgi:SAM-dependent methyltransferase